MSTTARSRSATASAPRGEPTEVQPKKTRGPRSEYSLPNFSVISVAQVPGVGKDAALLDDMASALRSSGAAVKIEVPEVGAINSIRNRISAGLAKRGVPTTSRLIEQTLYFTPKTKAASAPPVPPAEPTNPSAEGIFTPNGAGEDVSAREAQAVA
jgi:hypothetical protein